jgi:acetyl-CoA carboxylase carboxyltransferase component
MNITDPQHRFKVKVLYYLQVMDQALLVGAPVIGLNDSGGARIQVTPFTYSI